MTDFDAFDPLAHVATRITIERDGDEPAWLWTARDHLGACIAFGYAAEGEATEDYVIRCVGEQGVRVTDATRVDVDLADRFRTAFAADR